MTIAFLKSIQNFNLKYVKWSKCTFNDSISFNWCSRICFTFLLNFQTTNKCVGCFKWEHTHWWQRYVIYRCSGTGLQFPKHSQHSLVRPHYCGIYSFYCNNSPLAELIALIMDHLHGLLLTYKSNILKYHLRNLLW